ncbi:hypothetical protein BGAL_0756g00030 [Botrytis galanthina]|uniref:Uncharacterized protein n=1 Tax=Botrytis galanthina TaxID=278940 RepID=A0A4S8QKV1_9HELO|nr:hypothetical protein BGAL_0756g00030 [Botrytis galanthina]
MTQDQQILPTNFSLNLHKLPALLIFNVIVSVPRLSSNFALPPSTVLKLLGCSKSCATSELALRRQTRAGIVNLNSLDFDRVDFSSEWVVEAE